MGFRFTYRGVVAALTAAASFTGFALVCVPSASASPATPAPVTTARVRSLVTGMVRNGSTPLAGARVTLEAWPNGHTLATEPNGTVVPTRVVASVTTGSTGAYLLNPDLTNLDRSYVEPDGSVALELTTVTATSRQTYHLSGAVPGTRAVSDPADAAAGTRPARVSFDAAHLTITDPARAANITNDTGTVRVQSTISNGTTVPESAGLAPPTCGGWVSGDPQNGRPEHFLTLYSWSGAKGEVDESTTSSHSLGVAVSLNAGPFHADGAITKTTEVSGGMNQIYASNRTLWNRVNYRSYAQRCSGTTGSHVTHKIVATGFNALQDDGLSHLTPEVFWNYLPYGCQTLSSGTPRKIRGSNIEYSTGVSLAVPNGSLGVSARASFSTSTSITWHITAKTRLCGDSTIGWPDAPLAAARNYYDTLCVPGKPC